MASLRQQIATTALTLTKFRDLMKRMQENRPQDDLTIVKKAYDYSLKHHEGQTRASGEPYLVHPLEVALVLSEMKMDPVAVAAGLLRGRAGLGPPGCPRSHQRQNSRVSGVASQRRPQAHTRRIREELRGRL